MFDGPRLFNIWNGSERQRAVAAIQALRIGTHKVVIAPVTAEDVMKWKLHAMVRDIASGCKHARRELPAKQWRVLLKSGHAMVTSEPTDLVIGIENEYVDLLESTAQMSGPRIASLIDYAQAYGDLQGVRWSHSSNRPDGESR
jgi:hypothetical protein